MISLSTDRSPLAPFAPITIQSGSNPADDRSKISWGRVALCLAIFSIASRSRKPRRVAIVDLRTIVLALFDPYTIGQDGVEIEFGAEWPECGRSEHSVRPDEMIGTIAWSAASKVTRLHFLFRMLIPVHFAVLRKGSGQRG